MDSELIHSPLFTCGIVEHLTKKKKKKGKGNEADLRLLTVPSGGCSSFLLCLCGASSSCFCHLASLFLILFRTPCFSISCSISDGGGAVVDGGSGQFLWRRRGRESVVVVLLVTEGDKLFFFFSSIFCPSAFPFLSFLPPFCDFLSLLFPSFSLFFLRYPLYIFLVHCFFLSIFFCSSSFTVPFLFFPPSRFFLFGRYL